MREAMVRSRTKVRMTQQATKIIIVRLARFSATKRWRKCEFSEVHSKTLNTSNIRLIS